MVLYQNNITIHGKVVIKPGSHGYEVYLYQSGKPRVLLERGDNIFWKFEALIQCMKTMMRYFNSITYF